MNGQQTRVSDEELRRLIEESTPGRWHLGEKTGAGYVWVQSDRCVRDFIAEPLFKTRSSLGPPAEDVAHRQADAELIAAAPDLARELLSLRSAGRWIPVEEKLPDDGERVGVWYRGAFWTARHEKGANTYAWALPTGYAGFNEIRFWQPLPAPPEGKKE